MCSFGERPNGSIPAALGGYAETMAGYRFFANEVVTHDAILAPHRDATLARMRNEDVALLVQDTSELDVTRPKQQVKGAGPLDGGARQGAFLHPLQGFRPAGVPLGTAWHTFWVRDASSVQPGAEDKAAKRERQRLAPIESKESFRWLEAFRAAREISEQIPDTQFIQICDSEGDIYELLAEPRGNAQLHLLVRAARNRALDRTSRAKDSENNGPNNSMLDAVAATPVLFTRETNVRGREPKITGDTRRRRQPRQSRVAQVEVRATKVSVRPPPRPDRKLPTIQVNVVLVRGINPPPGDVPIEWLLVTTLPIDTVEEVETIIRYYTVRFMIEVLFRTLKSGCRVEERQFEYMDRLLPCLAVYLIVAWRTLMLARLGQSCPDLDCEAVFEPSEWKAVWVAMTRQPIPSNPPRLIEMLKLVAQLGGYVNRPNRRDPPGAQTIWLGLQRARDLTWAWDTFGPGAKPP